MIAGSCTNFTTVYIVLKNAQIVSDVLEQLDAAITFDVAFCFNAKQMQMKFPE